MKKANIYLMMNQKMDNKNLKEKEYIQIIEKDFGEINEKIKNIRCYNNIVHDKILYVYEELNALYKYINRSNKLKKWILNYMIDVDLERLLKKYSKYLLDAYVYLKAHNRHNINELNKKTDEIRKKILNKFNNDSKNR